MPSDDGQGASWVRQTRPMSPSNEEQAAYWEDRTASWLAAERHTARVSGLFGPLAIDRLRLQPGERVLDIGCGSGPTTVELARQVAPEGEAVGADIAPGMIAAARQRAESDGVANTLFVVADAQTTALDGAPFDAAFSRFGVMFFADAEQAFANIRASLVPGGRLAFVCWRELLANEWMLVPGSAVVAVTGELPPMPGPGEPGPFSLAEPGRVEAVLAAAGFNAIEVEAADDEVVLRADELESWVELAQAVGPVRQALMEADDELRARVLDGVREALRARVVDGQLRLSASAWLVTATA